MSTSVSRAEAWDLLTEWVTSASLRKHCLAVEASMRAVARARGEDTELWGVTGLLHDMDYERFPDAASGHPRMALAELERRDADPAILHAVTAHATYLGVEPNSDMARALLAVDELSGFVLAVAYVRPEGIHGMTPKSVKKKLKTPAFAAGPITVAATDVGPYLAAHNDTESDLSRLARHDAFWQAWLKAIAASTDAGAVPGETATGIGRFVSTLAAGPASIETLPVTATTTVGDEFTIKQEAASARLSSAVPFPTSTPDTPRTRVRVLDGVGASSSGLALVAASVLVPAGAEVAVVGNADHFGYPTTVVRYSDEADKAAAEALERAIGLGTVEQGNILDDVVAVTIVLGNDFAARYGSPSDVTSISPPTST